MPELPEVETVVRDLNKKIKGKIVSDVWTDAPKLIKDHKKPAARFPDAESKKAKANFARLKRGLINKKVLRAERRGKNVLIYLSQNKLLLIHQKMTGHLLVGKWKIGRSGVRAISPATAVNDPFNGYIHLIISFKDGSQLALSDMRKFAKAILAEVEEISATPDIAGLGPDALDPKLNLRKFSQLLKKSGPTIKQALLKPELISGIGNIYADESLFMAKIHPRQDPKKLSTKELAELYKSIRKILRKAIRLRGTSTSDFRDTAGKPGGYTRHRLVYQREGMECKLCQTPIKRIKLGARSAHFCPECQRPIKLYQGGKKE